ncbi:Coenzyme F420 hydrogenase/dehydrogenase, beta subunit C-terminal domain [Clostridium sp.]|uniref:Coenzyme F420 hydrogenase/dehydrogenase, beta subunit C-terminal domain n=1 Tax=Clostridium sp. TaxID=1506 RepID=UPI0028FF4741|nr:Coenzyme F420 hydrogenase/dehydrogenase, beta subunit C-terminal domain [Clostridium sp.]MBS7130553.1 Coenzyme F420 hydrogenase/dehydrogenase, beta subunit C-terminal domain [Clostridium sp.]MDU2284601.1 Coenzyme F420 hydrogenase/dehydrogenase, beta subunit C-terminal domain [Clostridium sp.]
MSINIEDKSKCCGCRACEQICPIEIIHMEEDTEGFIYPQVGDKCIECKLCEKVCPLLNDNKKLSEEFVPKVYAAHIKDEEILVNSSSGGIFTALAEAVLRQQGMVFGAAYNEEMNVEHICINKIDDLHKLRGSKYVQSNTLATYGQVKQILGKERYVLYVGTPCQIAGLKRYLGKVYERLITVDLVCHGTPSPKIFREYIQYLNSKSNKKVKEFNFRYKGEYGWGLRYQLKFNCNKDETNIAALSPYYYAFLNDMLHRPVCYSCPYATEQREGDITLADYWGIEQEHPKAFNEKGNSLIIVNSTKGAELLGKIESKLEIVESSMDVAKKKNGNLSKPSNKHSYRDIIYIDLEKHGFKYISKKYCRPRKYLRLKISNMIPSTIKKYLKKL